MIYRLNTMAEFEALKNRNTGAKKAPATKRTDNKYKAEIDRIFAVLGCDVVKEYRFAPQRRWALDWAAVEIKVCVEYQGLNFTGGTSRHQTIGGISGDAEKFSELAIRGWLLILATAITVDKGITHNQLKRAIDSRRITLPEINSAQRYRFPTEVV